MTAQEPKTSNRIQAGDPDRLKPGHPNPNHRLWIPLGLGIIYLLIWLYFGPKTKSGLMTIPLGQWQFLPLQPLLEHPWASLWYLNGQPPVMNVLVLIVHKIAAWIQVRPESVAAALFAPLALLACVAWFEVAWRRFRSVGAATALLVLLLINPSFWRWLGTFQYTFMMLFYFGVFFWLAARWAERPTTGRLIAAASILVLIIYTRSLWHPLSATLILAWMGLHLWRRTGDLRLAFRQAGLAIVFLYALIVPWMLKNHYVANSAAFSSWLGLNMKDMSNKSSFPAWDYVTTGKYDEKIVEQYYRPEQLARLKANPSTSMIYHTLPDGTQMINLHHYAMPAICYVSMEIAKQDIINQPYRYVVRCASQFIDFDLPPYWVQYSLSFRTGEYRLAYDNAYARWHDAIYHGAFLKKLVTIPLTIFPYHPSLFALVLLPLSMLWALIRARRPGTEDGLMSGLEFFVYAWLVAMCVLIDGPEAARYRWPVEPIYLLMLFGLGRAIWTRMRAQFHASNSSAM